MSSLKRYVSPTVAFVSIISLLLAGCGHEPVRRVADDQRRSGEISRDKSISPGSSRRRTAGEHAASVALRQVGVPYQYGGATEQGFDCSGLVQFAYANSGIRIPRTTAGQWQKLAAVRSSDVRVGDLLFFRIAGKISHVGLYVGENRFVHAPSSGRNVAVARLDTEFYRRALVRAARPK